MLQACSADEQVDIPNNVTDVAAHDVQDSGRDVLQGADDALPGDIGLVELPEDEDYSCHTDCWGYETCIDGVMYYYAHGAAPCWVQETYPGQGVCLTWMQPCVEGVCGERNIACRDEENWVWPGGIEPTESVVEGFRNDDGWRGVLIYQTREFNSTDEDGLRMRLAGCEYQVVPYNPIQHGFAECEMSLERGSMPTLETKALVRVLEGRGEDWKVGSVTWVEADQLSRLDWWAEPGMGSSLRMVLLDDVSGPVPDWVPPIGPDEGSGGVDEGSGSVDEGSGGTDEGSGCVDEGSGAAEGSGV